MTDLPTFVNEPIGELRRASVRDELSEGMATLERKLPLHVPVWIGTGERHGDEIASTDPGHPERLVANAASATKAEVDEAVQTAAAGFKRWS
jgi:RHH-type transcriptional regulator, proline utilization regulon repressor / proline dehydrogenase / delta 1-pyrroline-5-carboxylate dehydrogenase